MVGSKKSVEMTIVKGGEKSLTAPHYLTPMMASKVQKRFQALEALAQLGGYGKTGDPLENFVDDLTAGDMAERFEEEMRRIEKDLPFHLYCAGLTEGLVPVSPGTGEIERSRQATNLFE